MKTNLVNVNIIQWNGPSPKPFAQMQDADNLLAQIHIDKAVNSGGSFLNLLETIMSTQLLFIPVLFVLLFLIFNLGRIWRFIMPKFIGLFIVIDKRSDAEKMFDELSKRKFELSKRKNISQNSPQIV